MFIDHQNPDPDYGYDNDNDDDDDYESIDFIDQKDADFNHKAAILRSINDDMCYYLKPPSTAILNVKVSFQKYEVCLYEKLKIVTC